MQISTIVNMQMGYSYESFQSTISMQISTICYFHIKDSVYISIHDIHADIDKKCIGQVLYFNYFNPRYPCRYRQAIQVRRSRLKKFQSTISMQISTEETHLFLPLQIISIHDIHADIDIEPFPDVSHREISIHDIHADIDSAKMFLSSFFLYFNPRYPCRYRLI